MSSETTNLHLVKPTSADTADIGIINGNMDIIDDAVANHTHEAGTITNLGIYKFHDQGDWVSTESGSYKTVCSLSLEAGSWIINFHAHFATNGTGYRYICISKTDNGSDAAWNRWSGIQLAALPSNNTYLGTTVLVNPSSTATYYGIVQQGSGGALNVCGAMEAIRIK